MNVTFLTLAEALEIHRDQISRYGGNPGFRDYGLLQSALAMPGAGFGEAYVHGDLYEMAAAYLYHVVRNHPFIDGNKRTGAVAALVFLDLSGVEIAADENTFENIVRAVAKGEMGKKEVAAFFRTHGSIG